MSKPVDKRLFKNYIQKAEEMLDIAEMARQSSKNNAAVTASIHCAINALDALAVFYLGKRHTGSHDGTLNFVKGALSKIDFDDVAKQFGGLIELKNRAEYQPDLMGSREAIDAVKRASRIMSKVKQKLPSN